MSISIYCIFPSYPICSYGEDGFAFQIDLTEEILQDIPTRASPQL